MREDLMGAAQDVKVSDSMHARRVSEGRSSVTKAEQETIIRWDQDSESSVSIPRIRLRLESGHASGIRSRSTVEHRQVSPEVGGLRHHWHLFGCAGW